MSATIELSQLPWLLIPTLLWALSFTVLYHNRRSLANRIFSLFLFTVALWLLAGVVFFTFPALLPRLLPLQMIAGSAFSLLFLLFTRAFVDEDYSVRLRDFAWALPTLYVICYAAALAASPSLFTAYADGVWIDGGRLHREPTIHYLLYSIGVITCSCAGLAVLLRGLLRTKEPFKRQRIVTVLVFIAVGFIGGFILNNVTTLAGHGGYEQLSVIPLLTAAAGVAVSLLRHKAWTIEHLLDIIEERNRVIEQELDMARLIQRKLLPQETPRLAGIGFHALYLPMDKVGGDYYDFREDGDSLDVIIADVTGHGVPGAFLAGITQAAFRFHHGAGMRGAALMERLDAMISARTVRSLFVTAALVRLNLGSRLLSYCRAGHCTPLLLRGADGAVIELHSSGKALGLTDKSGFEEKTIGVLPGDRVVIYTDGLVEARSASGEMFGEERLRETLKSARALPAEETCRFMVSALGAFTNGVPGEDDVTMVVIDIL